MKNGDQVTAADQIGELLRLLRPAFRGTYAAVEANLESTGITAPMLGMLELLSDARGRSVPDMAKELLIPRQFSLKLAGKLVEQGHAVREHTDAHRKAYTYNITPSGKAMLRLIRQREHAASKELRKTLTNREIDIASRVLRKIAQHFPMAASGDD